MSLKFIDNHTHGAFGVDFNFCNYKELKFLLRELYKRKIKGVVATLVGDSADDLQRQLALFQKVKDEQLEKIDKEALLIGAHLEGSFLSKDKAGIQDSSNFLEAKVVNYKFLVGDFSSIVKIVTIAPENDYDLIDYLNSIGVKTQAGHTVALDIKNCQATTHHFNAMNSIHHRSPSIALSALVDDNIYCEIIADLIHTSYETLALFFRQKPIEKVLLISDSLPSSHFDNDIIFCNKKINKFGKNSDGTLAGSIKTLDEICYKLIEKNILTEAQIQKAAFENQIKYLNLKDIEIDILNR